MTNCHATKNLVYESRDQVLFFPLDARVACSRHIEGETLKKHLHAGKNRTTISVA